MMDEATAADRAPARLKVVGAFLALVGGLTTIGPLTDSSGLTRIEVAGNVAAGVVMLVAGFGLMFSHRWAWPPALIVAVVAVGLGAYSMLPPGDITMPGEFIVAFVLLVLPGVVMATALLTPRSFRWFRRRQIERA